MNVIQKKYKTQAKSIIAKLLKLLHVLLKISLPNAIILENSLYNTICKRVQNFLSVPFGIKYIFFRDKINLIITLNLLTFFWQKTL